MIYEIYGDSSFKINVEIKILKIFGFIGSGLLLMGVGVVIEFSKKMELGK